MARKPKAQQQSRKRKSKAATNTNNANGLKGFFLKCISLLGHCLSQAFRMFHWTKDSAVQNKEIVLAHGVREFLMIAFATLAVLSAGSLITFEPLVATGTISTSSNFAGKIGYHVSLFLFRNIGILAFLVPLILGYCMLSALRNRALILNPSVVLMRIIGFFFSMVALSALVQMHWPSASVYNGWAGGYLGRYTENLFVHWFSIGGANLILISVLLVTFTWAVRISWIQMFEQIGAFAEKLVVRIYHGIQSLLSNIRSGSDKSIKLDDQPQPASEALAMELDSTKTSSRQSAKTAASKSIPSAVIDESITPAEQFEPEKPKPPKIALRKKRQKSLFKPSGKLPGLNLLDPVDEEAKQGFTHEDLTQLSSVLEAKLKDFGIQARVETVLPGPVVTRFEIQPAAGIKVSKITNLAKD